MMILLLVSFLIGTVLGQGFKVFVLAPLFVIALVVTIGAGVSHADTAWSIVLTAATVAIGMQLGYFFGLGLRLVLVAALARLHVTVPAAPTSARHPTR
jgi:fumarate reductase subunit C